MAQSHVDRNLLFGILALQLGFLSRDQLIAGMNAWVLEKHKPLGQVLVEQHAFKADTRAALDLLVDKHLERQDHQPEQSLAALSVPSELHQDLGGIADAELHASLPTIPPPGTPVHRVGVLTGQPGPERAPAAVGEPTASGLRFLVLRPHKEGGLGVVSVARDRELNRDVALKEIKPERADEAGARARFLAEAEITGGLEHPGVVPVYGLGRHADGRLYYAMRFVHGESLQQGLERFHATDWKEDGAGARALALRGLLRRFVDVCNAVAYAHSRGVIHRDLKPANVLLGPFGETLLVDWGLAKPLQAEAGKAVPPQGYLRPSSGAAVATQAGAVVGTPPYMAPEQASGGAVGPAADVYGLGAMLYYLLAGQAPFGGADAVQIVMQVVQGHCKPAREINKSVPAALSAVCQKAMALAPQDRYASAKELAAEVESWLADEPVTAYREPSLARLARWARRHRPLVASAAALLLTVVAALAVGIIAVNRERERTEVARQRTREALDEMSSQVIEDWLSQRKQLEPAQRDFLQKALAYYEAFAQESGHTAEARKRVANAQLRVGKICEKLGQHPPAEAAYSKARELYGRLVADFPSVAGYRHQLAQSHRNLGLLLKDTGHLKEAEAAYHDALDILKPLAEDPQSLPEYYRDLAQTHNNLAILLWDTGRVEEAATAFRDARDAETRLMEEAPTEPKYRSLLAITHNNLGNLLADTDHPQEAEAAYREGLDVFQRLADEFPTMPDYRRDLAWNHNHLAILLAATGRPKPAEVAYCAALALQKRLAAHYPAVPEYRQELARTYNNLAILQVKTGRAREAETPYRDAQALYQRLADDFPEVPDYRRELALSQNNLGNLFADTSRPKEAEAAYKDAQQNYKALVAEFPEVPDYRARVANALVGLAELAQGRKDYRAARQLLAEAQPHLQRALAVNHKHPFYRAVFREHRRDLAATLLELGEHTGAAEAAADLARIAFEPASDAYKAACFFSRCIPLAEKDNILPPAQRQALVRSYGDQALEAMQQALAKGYKELANLKKDKDLDPLRQREDFKKLLTELEVKPKDGR
jgi:serine/threonine-protein kinase